MREQTLATMNPQFLRGFGHRPPRRWVVPLILALVGLAMMGAGALMMG